MSEKFTIKIPREDGERHNERRKERGMTWLEYIDGQAPSREMAVTITPQLDEDALEDVREQVEAELADAATGAVATDALIDALRAEVADDG